MTMLNLFNEQTGFRLARLEMLNWGTFDREIWILTPDCQTAVLTGPNGSGKSTVVDALLTLLVDSRRRNYNLASATSSSRERSERTYVRGQYSRSRGESAIESRANTLRGSESHSVLLAVFYDEALDKTVTLAQILWISNVDRVEKRYYVGHCDLSIQQHFTQRHITGRDLPKEVQPFSNVFKDYIAAARKVLGLGGRPKALDLFNETVAVKDIASLNTFVRDHMLDKGNPEAQAQVLREQYRDLNDAYASIQRARRQLEILAPLMDASQSYRHYEQQIARYNEARRLVPFYVAERSRELLTQVIKSDQNQLDVHYSRRESEDTRLENFRHELQTVEFAIETDSVGQMKREIENRLPALVREIEILKRVASRYDENAHRLGFSTYRDEQDFYDNRARAEEMYQTTDVNIHALASQLSDTQIEQHDLIQQAQTIDQEITYLRDHLSNIPAEVARIREEISAALDIPTDELPFIGELLRVREGEIAWEGILERLLHSFAQELLVPGNLYEQVSRYVNDTHLGGRLIYRQVNLNSHPQSSSERRTDSVMAYDKLEIKEATPYGDWLAATLMRRFNYACCETLAEFQQADRAITPQGQIKHSVSRHEKDDRRHLHDRRHYVLGWDNRAKLRQFENELDELQQQVQMLQESVEAINANLTRKRSDLNALESLLKIETFADIDWHARQDELDRLKRQLDELNQKAQPLRQLEQKRDELRRQIQEAVARRDAINREITTLENRIEGYERQLIEAQHQLTNPSDNIDWLWEQVGDVLEEIIKEPLTIDRLSGLPNALRNSIQSSINNFTGYQSDHRVTILDAMNNFRREYPDEGVTLTVEVGSLTAFEQIYTRLESDALPRHEARFKQMLNRTVTNGVMAFYSHLSEQERGINRSIDELNASLAQVDYGNGSAIRLIAEPTPDPEINEFQRDLKACIPDAGDNSPEELERAYTHIKALIERFDEDPNWMQRVIDVRRWRVFAAEQIDAAGHQVDYYNDSSGKSGGQKAKLAYTILASAIAHQYGLQDGMSGNRSFRFVVIDEAFSKLDDDNARFAMQLFEQLGLQLLVVTPMQQLHVIEDYVKAYHLVVNNPEGSFSELYNLTHTEYYERQREFQAQGQMI
jgi:uncharacterized protein YPO0396